MRADVRRLLVTVLASLCLGAAGGSQAQVEGQEQVVKLQGNPTVYLVTADGSTYPFLNPETFLGCGFKWTDVVTVTRDWLDDAFKKRLYTIPDVPTCVVARGMRPAPKAPAERAPVSGEGSPDVYYVLPDGKKLHIAGSEVFLACGLSWNSVQKISRQQLEAMPSGPALPDATACRTARRASFLAGADAPRGVAEMLGKVVSIPGNTNVYLVTDWGTRHLFSDPEPFHGCGYRWIDIQTVSPLPLFYLNTGAALVNAADCKRLLR